MDVTLTNGRVIHALLFKLQRMDATLTNGRFIYALLFKFQRMDATLTNGRVIYALLFKNSTDGCNVNKWSGYICFVI